MIRENSAWHEKRETKIGDYGEELVIKHLESKNFVCYKAVTNASHPFDFLVSKNDELFFVEVKTKPRRKYYPDTGFDIRSYKRYLRACETTGRRMFVFFVDVQQKQIYGNFLDELEERCIERFVYPFEDRGIRYYPLSKMKIIRELSDEEVNTIQSLRDGEAS